MSDESAQAGPLTGFRIGVTAARKAEEQVALFERRGAQVVWAPVLSMAANQVEDASLRAATDQVLAGPVDLFLATTGIGLKAWFGAAESWGLLDPLLSHLSAAEILARGPKSVGALRRSGLREEWSPESEEFDDVLARLRTRDLRGQRVVVQEHGQPLIEAVAALREQGAEVIAVTVYRTVDAEDSAPVFHLIDQIADRAVHAVTFTSAPAVVALMEAAQAAGRRDDVVAALRSDVLACCVGPLTAAALEPWDVSSIHPDRFRLAAMIKQVEIELPLRVRATS